MSLSRYPSRLSLPLDGGGARSVLDYLISRFPDIPAEVWRQRVARGKVHWHDGALIDQHSAYRAQQRVYYYREVEQEPIIPFREQVLYRDEHILVADKPHFLPVTPGGIYVSECLQNRLRADIGNDNLQALHRLDRATSGLVLFSVNPESRHLYHKLFSDRRIDKRYQALAHTAGAGDLQGQTWQVRNRLVKAQPRFLMKVADGAANSHTRVRCVRQWADRALFELQPVTGKTHQLRVHMHTLGWPVLNDRFYPTLQPEAADDYATPLQLLARELRFIDPVTQQSRTFTSTRTLSAG